MGWLLQCSNSRCRKQDWASNIVELLSHADKAGWFRCPCGWTASIAKSFQLQEKGNTWEPFLRGVIRLGKSGETYQPFVFLVSYKPAGKVVDIWFSYYKDLRPRGKLKVGHGPGGPPVLGKLDLIRLVRQLRTIDCLTDNNLRSISKRTAQARISKAGLR